MLQAVILTSRMSVYTAYDRAYATVVEGARATMPSDGDRMQVILIRSSSLPTRIFSILIYA